MKLFKKAKQRKVLEQYGVHLSESPTNMLAVKNGGLINGVTCQTIHDLLANLNLTLPATISQPELKPYSILQFNTEHDCISALDKLDGYSLDTAEINCKEARRILYCFYVDHLGKTESELLNCFPEGLRITENFVDEETERELIDLALEAVSKNESENQQLKQRRVAHFGHVFDYSTNAYSTEPCPAIPPVCSRVLDDVMRAVNEVGRRPDQVTVNVYSPGDGIPPHVDTHSPFGPTILSLSLQSGIVITFTRGDQKAPVLLPKRSLLVMQGAARYDWKHGITARKHDSYTCPLTGQSQSFVREPRISFTFRSTRSGPCTCNFPVMCDSRSLGSSLPSTEEEAERLESQHVVDVYNSIAPHFSSTRHSPWPRVRSFIEHMERHSVLVDLGCGNGKYIVQPDQPLFKVGADVSSGLAEICASRSSQVQVLVSDCLNCPIRDRVADYVISIAVIHHMSTRERRLRAVREISRILRRGGRALIYVWAFEQKLEATPSHYISNSAQFTERVQPETPEAAAEKAAEAPEKQGEGNSDKRIAVHKNRTAFSQQDLFVPWQKKSPAPPRGSARSRCERTGDSRQEEEQVFHRFYHVFVRGELEGLVTESSCGLRVAEGYYDDGNWCVVLEKIV